MSITPHAWQLDAVSAFDRLGGVFCAMPAGAGKTYVAAQCLARGLRPLIVTKAAARKQTEKMLLLYGVQAEIISFNAISLDDGLLARLAPDVIVFDEGHALKNVKGAAWSKRIARYLAAHPLCKVMISTGSIMHRSVLDYAHMLVWALRQYAPVPRSQAAWPRFALDVERNPSAWLERLRDTPGVFLDAAPSWNGRLQITEHWPELLLTEHYARAEQGVAPDGWELTEGWAQDELLEQLAWGYYLRRDPRPSPALLDAQRTWNRCVEQARAYGLADTEKDTRGVYPGAYAQWLRAQEAEPESAQVVEWLTESSPLSLLGATSWPVGTIVWVHHVALGEELARRTGWRYHREGGRDERGVRLDETNNSIVLASLSACSESFNAQYNFHHMIYLEPPADPRMWQQSLARVCRQGQAADEVTCEIVVAAPVFGKALDSARRGARKIEEQTAQQQLLLSGERG